MPVLDHGHRGFITGRLNPQNNTFFHWFIRPWFIRP
jgi:hypothetical protein